MINKEYVIHAAEGIHARPATALIRLAKTFKSACSLRKGERTVRLNSMLNILSLAAKRGDTIVLTIEGEDETEAAQALDVFFAAHLKDM